MNRVPSPEETLFADALALPAAERASFPARTCGDKVDRLAQLVALLAAHDEPGAIPSFGSAPGEQSNLTAQ